MTFRKPLVRVITFHDVNDSLWFERTLTALTKECVFVTPDDFVAKRFHEERINVLVTFDDGYRSWIHICLPVLMRMNIKAVFFINSGLVDAAHNTTDQEKFVREQLLLSSRNTIDWGGVKTLHKRGYTIGGHTTTHDRLSELTVDAQQKIIEDDKKRIEAEIGDTIHLFAYPFGNPSDYTPVTETLVQKAGYTHAFSLQAAFADSGETYEVSRLSIEDRITQKDVVRWVQGGYDLYAKVKRLCVR